MHRTGPRPAGESIPPRLPGLTLLRLRGRGATSTVYAARRDVDGWPCAIKVVESPRDRDRVRREIDVLTAVSAPGLVRLHDVLTTDDGRPALVLDLVDGGVLREVVAQRGRLIAREATGVVRVLLQALAALHERGVVHGDLSAGNVLLDSHGRAVLGDLGSARLVGERTREVWATRGFLAPEVEVGGPPTAASDVYGVGALAWLMLTGEVPGQGYGRTPAHEALPGCPEPLIDLVSGCLAGDPALRPTAAEALARSAELGAEEPLALPAGPGLGERLTARVAGRSDLTPGDEWAGLVVDPDSPLARLGLDAHGRWRGSGRGTAAGHHACSDGGRGSEPGRHRGSTPGRWARAAAACGRAGTGPAGRTVAAALAGMLLGLAAWVGVAAWRGSALPLVGVVALPFGGGPAGDPASSAPVTTAAPTRPTGGAAPTNHPTGDAAPTNHPSGDGAPTNHPTGDATTSSQAPAAASGSSAPTLTSPARALPALLGERARAYATADLVPLERCYASDAAGLAAARSEVQRLARAGTRYDGLAYTVRGARVLSQSDRDGVHGARVAARVSTEPGAAAAVLAGSGTGVGSARAADAEPVSLVFEMRWTDAGWRLVTITADETR